MRSGRLLVAEVALLAAVLCALLFRLGSPALLDDPNDGQYAEVAREMFDSGDWISPTLNGVLFLNKPPLTYWLIALSYAAFGINELAARLPGALATWLTIALLLPFGRALGGPRTGIAAAAAYAAMPGVWIEARFVRPDALLTCSVTAALLAFVIAAQSQGRKRRIALAGMAASVACGVMAKGIVAVFLPAFAVVLAIVAAKQWRLAREILAVPNLLIFLSIVTPWHAAAAMRHDGFAWDYIVNQHFLFFFDRKLPRDSVPISLSAFWAAFVGRGFPWTLLLPWALYRTITGGDTRARVTLLAWIAGTLAFFSLNVSRLEHYSIPALPAVALLVSSVLIAGRASRRSEMLGPHLFALLVVCSAAIVFAPGAIARTSWLADITVLPQLARIFFAVFACAVALAFLFGRRSGAAAVHTLATAGIATVPIVHAGLVALAPINSSAPVADLLRAYGVDRAAVVCEAPVEYQQCAGLAFYLRRPLLVLRPDGFVDPPYLAPHSEQLFTDREELLRLWRSSRVLVVTDPLAPSSRDPLGRFPTPAHRLATLGSRHVISNEKF